MNEKSLAVKTNRIEALDVTKGLSVLGMMYMNFKIVFSKIPETQAYSFATSQEGRFGALFIFMAGMGIALMHRKILHRSDKETLLVIRKKILKRALFLLLTGSIFALYWQADILHFYALYLTAGVFLIQASKKQLWIITLILPFVFTAAGLIIPWERGWNMENLNYIDFWSLKGYLRNIFLNGFHPFFPWFSFFLLGMIMGKSPLESTGFLKKGAITGGLILITVEILSWSLSSSGGLQMIIFSSAAFPPYPLFVISAGAQSVLIFCVTGLILTRIKGRGLIFRILSETGRMVMTHYIGHLLLGMGLLFLFSSYMELNAFWLIIYTFAYFIFSAGLTLLWRKRFKTGPMEGLMRKLSD